MLDGVLPSYRLAALERENTHRRIAAPKEAPEAMTGAGWRPVVGLPLVPAGEEGAAEGAAE